MVLLTSSGLSVIVSTGVISLFTFLLFLSGWVIQQRTVASLQLALHPPPLPKSTLPVYFQDVQDQDVETETAAVEETIKILQSVADAEESNAVVQTAFGDPPGSRGHANYQQAISDSQPGEETEKAQVEVRVGRGTRSTPTSKADRGKALSYVQVLTSPAQICSALVFFRMVIEQGSSVQGRMILYPAIWEQHTASDAVSSALALMRIASEKHGIVCAPISVGNDMDTEVIEDSLIRSLSEYNFPYERTLFLRSPGLLSNIRTLDGAMRAVGPAWRQMPDRVIELPTALLLAPNETVPVMVPSWSLVIEANTSHDHQHQEEMEIEAIAGRAGYIHFDSKELEHRRKEKEWSYGGLFDKYQRSTAEVCRGVSFEERSELRRK